MNKYHEFLPNYSVGTDCYKEIPWVCRRFGTKVVVIGGKTAMEKARQALLEGVEDSKIEILEFVWYGGNATYENVEMLKEMRSVQDADMVFAVGGGRAVDTCKVLCDELDKPLFTFPTIASNCAGCTAISVMYRPDGTFHGYFYPQTPPDHTFIHTGIIAEAPKNLFWAGIGDALSKQPEVLLATRGKDLSHTPLMGAQLSRACGEPLFTYGAQALQDCEAGTVSVALEQVVLDIIITTGIVSNMTSCKEYYYNSSIAHCLYNSISFAGKVGEYLHGEIVSFGVLVLLAYDGQEEELENYTAFNRALGLPVCLNDLGLTPGDLPQILEFAPSTTEWTCAPYPLTKEKLEQTVLKVDARNSK